MTLYHDLTLKGIMKNKKNLLGLVLPVFLLSGATLELVASQPPSLYGEVSRAHQLLLQACNPETRRSQAILLSIGPDALAKANEEGPDALAKANEEKLISKLKRQIITDQELVCTRAHDDGDMTVSEICKRSCFTPVCPPETPAAEQEKMIMEHQMSELKRANTARLRTGNKRSVRYDDVRGDRSTNYPQTWYPPPGKKIFSIGNRIMFSTPDSQQEIGRHKADLKKQPFFHGNENEAERSETKGHYDFQSVMWNRLISIDNTNTVKIWRILPGKQASVRYLSEICTTNIPEVSHLQQATWVGLNSVELVYASGTTKWLYDSGTLWPNKETMVVKWQ